MLNCSRKQPLQRIGEKALCISPNFLRTRNCLYLGLRQLQLTTRFKLTDELFGKVQFSSKELFEQFSSVRESCSTSSSELNWTVQTVQLSSRELFEQFTSSELFPNCYSPMCTSNPVVGKLRKSKVSDTTAFPMGKLRQYSIYFRRVPAGSCIYPAGTRRNFNGSGSFPVGNGRWNLDLGRESYMIKSYT